MVPDHNLSSRPRWAFWLQWLPFFSALTGASPVLLPLRDAMSEAGHERGDPVVNVLQAAGDMLVFSVIPILLFLAFGIVMANWVSRASAIGEAKILQRLFSAYGAIAAATALFLGIFLTTSFGIIGLGLMVLLDGPIYLSFIACLLVAVTMAAGAAVGRAICALRH